MQDLLKQLQQLAPLAAQTTQAPWRTGYDSEDCSYRIMHPIGKSEVEYILCGELDQDDAAFIAAARNLLTPENLTLLMTAL